MAEEKRISSLDILRNDQIAYNSELAIVDNSEGGIYKKMTINQLSNYLLTKNFDISDSSDLYAEIDGSNLAASDSDKRLFRNAIDIYSKLELSNLVNVFDKKSLTIGEDTIYYSGHVYRMEKDLVAGFPDIKKMNLVYFVRVGNDIKVRNAYNLGDTIFQGLINDEQDVRFPLLGFCLEDAKMEAETPANNYLNVLIAGRIEFPSAMPGVTEGDNCFLKRIIFRTTHSNTKAFYDLSFNYNNDSGTQATNIANSFYNRDLNANSIYISNHKVYYWSQSLEYGRHPNPFGHWVKDNILDFDATECIGRFNEDTGYLQQHPFQLSNSSTYPLYTSSTGTGTIGGSSVNFFFPMIWRDDFGRFLGYISATQDDKRMNSGVISWYQYGKGEANHSEDSGVESEVLKLKRYNLGIYPAYLLDIFYNIGIVYFELTHTVDGVTTTYKRYVNGTVLFDDEKVLDLQNYDFDDEFGAIFQRPFKNITCTFACSVSNSDEDAVLGIKLPTDFTFDQLTLKIGVLLGSVWFIKPEPVTISF